jgi:hypothetical protein
MLKREMRAARENQGGEEQKSKDPDADSGKNKQGSVPVTSIRLRCENATYA